MSKNKMMPKESDGHTELPRKIWLSIYSLRSAHKMMPKSRNHMVPNGPRKRVPECVLIPDITSNGTIWFLGFPDNQWNAWAVTLPTSLGLGVL